MFNRRTLLRGVVLCGSAAVASSLFLPNDRVTAASATRPTVALGTRVIPSPNLEGVQAPPIVSRAQWGADESIRVDDRVYAPIRKLIVHHTASNNKPKDPASVVRLVESYQASGRGFSDTGYNFLIDHKGVIYEGRAARRYAKGEAVTGEDNKGWGVVGAHAKGYNAGSCGVCLIGNFDTATPTAAAIASLVWLLAWKASRQRIDATASDEYIDMYGGHHVFPNISGHRQVGQTLCPGAHLFAMLPAIREQVAARAGAWNPLLVDIPGVLRAEVGTLRASSTAGTVASSTSISTSTGRTSATPVARSSPATTPGSGTTLSGIRVASSTGTVYTAGRARSLGNPSSSGVSAVAALANAASGDGFWALGHDGKVAGLGGVAMLGDASGKGTAVDIVATRSGAGYWILLADGGIYPFGDAGYASSPKRTGLGGTALRMAARPKGDGYWVLMSDGTIHAFGAAPSLGAGTVSGSPVDLWPTPTGAGYWVLTKDGRVVPFGDAIDKGDLKRSKVKWSKSATYIVGTPTGLGYLIVNREGSMLAFGDAPVYASFGGSGITASGVAPAFT